MNKNLQQILDNMESEFEALGIMHIYNMSSKHGRPARYERFAKLIIRECVEVMYDNAIERKVPPDINQTPTQYAIAILEHFGVEE